MGSFSEHRDCLHDTASPSFETERCAHLFWTDCSCLFVFLSLDIHHHHHSSTRPSCDPHRGLSCTSHPHRIGHVSCTLSITSARFPIRHEHGSICIAPYRQTSTLSRTHPSPAVDYLVFCPSWQQREISHIVTCNTRAYACTLGRVVTIRFLP